MEFHQKKKNPSWEWVNDFYKDSPCLQPLLEDHGTWEDYKKHTKGMGITDFVGKNPNTWFLCEGRASCSAFSYAWGWALQYCCNFYEKSPITLCSCRSCIHINASP